MVLAFFLLQNMQEPSVFGQIGKNGINQECSRNGSLRRFSEKKDPQQTDTFPTLFVLVQEEYNVFVDLFSERND